MTELLKNDAVAPQAPAPTEFSWSANHFQDMLAPSGPHCGPATHQAWQRQFKKPRHTFMSRRNSCRNSFLPPALSPSSLWALAQSTRAKPKPSTPNQSRPRFTSSRSQPRNTDPYSADLGLKRGRVSASGSTSVIHVTAVPVLCAACVAGLWWPNLISSTRLAVRGRCSTPVNVRPGGNAPVITQDRRSLCRKLQSWRPSAPRSFWAHAQSTMSSQSRFRHQLWSSPSRPRNTDPTRIMAPALFAPVSIPSPATFKGATC